MDPEARDKQKKPRTEAQKAATAKALESLKARRQIARDVINDDMGKQVEEAEERIVAKVMSRMGVIKESEEDAPDVKKAVKKAVAVEKKKRVVVVEESDSSSSEEEVVIKKVKKVKEAPESGKAVPEVVAKRTTGNKLLDKMYGFS
jgi:hypothetical protein